MDKIGKIVYDDEDLIYKYNDEVDIPCLGMVSPLYSKMQWKIYED